MMITQIAMNDIHQEINAHHLLLFLFYIILKTLGSGKLWWVFCTIFL